MDGLFAGVAQWALGVMSALGYAGVALLVALENLLPVIPSEVILALAGFLASQGVFWLPAIVAAASVGSVLGALVLYGLGRWLGEGPLREILHRHGHLLLMDESDLDRAEVWFERYGTRAVLIGRVIPIVRSLISVPAGVAAMPVRRFVAFTALGGSLWNATLVGLGWLLGENWGLVSRYTGYLSWVISMLLAAAAAWFFWRRWRAQT